MVDQRKKKAEAIRVAAVKKYEDDQIAQVGKSQIKFDSYPTGILALDYALGTGGWPDRGITEVWGPPSIGKTTIFGGSVLRSVQNAGGLTATIATEPEVDDEWMAKNGVNPDYNVIFRPDNGEDAFEIMKDLVFDATVDYVLLDSLAGIQAEKAINSDKPQAFGDAALIAWGIRRAVVPSYKNRVGIMVINQIRDDSNPQIKGLVKPPGGWAMKHYAKLRIQVKPGKNRYTVKVPGMSEDKNGNPTAGDLVIGQSLTCVFKKNKVAQALGKRAQFDFYHIEHEGYPFGIDTTKDVISTGKITGVISGSGWLTHRTFPDGKLNGRAKVDEFLEANPEAIEEIRKDILNVMVNKQLAGEGEEIEDKT